MMILGFSYFLISSYFLLQQQNHEQQQRGCLRKKQLQGKYSPLEI